MHEEIVELLQSALLDEAHAVLQYRLHAMRALPVVDIPFNDVAEHLKEHAEAEEGHYKRLYDHLRRSGVEPRFGNDELIHHGDGANDVVAAHQEAERGAIDAYTEIMKLADEADDVETSQLVQDLLNDEIEHLNDFTRYSDLETLKRDQGERADEFVFASEEAALQYLANFTGKQVKVAAEVVKKLVSEKDVADLIRHQFFWEDEPFAPSEEEAESTREWGVEIFSLAGVNFVDDEKVVDKLTTNQKVSILKNMIKERNENIEVSVKDGKIELEGDKSHIDQYDL